VYGQTILVVWHDDRHGENEIYFKRSTNGGTTWESEVRLTTTSSDSSFPQIAVTGGGEVHVVFQDNRAHLIAQRFNIYYLRSPDLGVTWEEEVPIRENAGRSLRPSIAARNDVVHVSWHDISAGMFDIYYSRSTDAGVTWEAPPRQLTSKPASLDPDTSLPQHPPSLRPRIALAGERVLLTWYDCCHDREPLRRLYPDRWEIYVQESRNQGETFRNAVRLTDSPAESTFPDAVWLSNTEFLVAWSDMHQSQRTDIFTNRGETRNRVRVSETPLLSSGPKLARAQNTVGLVWYECQDDANFSFQVHFASSTDGGSTWTEPEILTDAPRFAGFPSMTADSSNFYLVYMDDRHAPGYDVRVNTHEIYFMRGTR
jgi:hypothetical protein